MGAIAKLIAGLIIFLIGVYWYVAPLFGNHFFSSGGAKPCAPRINPPVSIF